MSERKAFKFKQFAIFHDKCAMKVGTDAVLLGAWANVKNASSILDIGTGTGIIALMLAQKSTAKIDAIEIDNNAAFQAKENCNLSKWKNQLSIHNLPIQDFSKEATIKYDVIVSNPPYFIDAVKAPKEARKIARHTDELSFEDLMNSVNALLNPNGTFYTILPVPEAEILINLAGKGLFIQKITEVIPRTNKPSKRFLMAFSFIKTEAVNKDSLTIEHLNRHEYTDAYKKLTKDYYLAF